MHPTPLLKAPATASSETPEHMDDQDKQDKPSAQLNIELSDGMAEGEYANLVMIAHSPEEFIIDFIRVMPGVRTARVKSRIIITPQHAKRLLRALADNIERFERAHGTIAERSSPDQPIQFGSGHVGQA